MAKAKNIKSFEEFWPIYLKEHSNPTNRRIHVTATTVGIVLLVYCLLIGRIWHMPLVIAAVYGVLFLGHYQIEGNKPMTLTHPLWSFRADLKMTYLYLTGKLN